jgi:hypothetical protein
VTRRLTVTSGVSSVSSGTASGGWRPSTVAGLEINLDADQCRVLDSPKTQSPTSGDLPSPRMCTLQTLGFNHFLRRKRFAPRAFPPFQAVT